MLGAKCAQAAGECHGPGQPSPPRLWRHERAGPADLSQSSENGCPGVDRLCAALPPEPREDLSHGSAPDRRISGHGTPKSGVFVQAPHSTPSANALIRNVPHLSSKTYRYDKETEFSPDFLNARLASSACSGVPWHDPRLPFRAMGRARRPDFHRRCHARATIKHRKVIICPRGSPQAVRMDGSGRYRSPGATCEREYL